MGKARFCQQQKRRFIRIFRFPRRRAG